MPRSTLIPKFNKGDLIGGEFEVVKKLGEGGCGSVYRCTWTKKPGKDKDGRDIALKLLENSSDLPRFIREAKVLRKTRHDNVIKLLGSGYHNERPFIVLEFMDGGSVRDLLDSRGKLGVEESAWILVQTIRGLKASKTVHRDLKPENLLIGKGSKGRGVSLVVGDTAEGAVIKVADFGLAKQPDASTTRLTNTGQVMGTPVYMSPEQCRNTKNVSTKSDIYALGVMLYEMVVGRPPFDAGNLYDIMAMHCNDEPKFPRIDQRIKDICAKCLEKTPGKRYQTLFALERDLTKVVGIGDPEPESSSSGVVVIIVFILAVLGGVGWYFRERIVAFGHEMGLW